MALKIPSKPLLIALCHQVVYEEAGRELLAMLLLSGEILEKISAGSPGSHLSMTATFPRLLLTLHAEPKKIVVFLLKKSKTINQCFHPMVPSIEIL